MSVCYRLVLDSVCRSNHHRLAVEALAQLQGADAERLGGAVDVVDADVAALGNAYKALGDGLAALASVVPEGYALDLEAIFERAGIPLKALPKLPPPAAPGKDTN